MGSGASKKGADNQELELLRSQVADLQQKVKNAQQRETSLEQRLADSQASAKGPVGKPGQSATDQLPSPTKPALPIGSSLDSAIESANKQPQKLSSEKRQGPAGKKNGAIVEERKFSGATSLSKMLEPLISMNRGTQTGIYTFLLLASGQAESKLRQTMSDQLIDVEIEVIEFDWESQPWQSFVCLITSVISNLSIVFDPNHPICQAKIPANLECRRSLEAIFGDLVVSFAGRAVVDVVVAMCDSLNKASIKIIDPSKAISFQLPGNPILPQLPLDIGLRNKAVEVFVNKHLLGKQSASVAITSGTLGSDFNCLVWTFKKILEGKFFDRVRALDCTSDGAGFRSLVPDLFGRWFVSNSGTESCIASTAAQNAVAARQWMFEGVGRLLIINLPPNPRDITLPQKQFVHLMSGMPSVFVISSQSSLESLNLSSSLWKFMDFNCLEGIDCKQRTLLSSGHFSLLEANSAVPATQAGSFRLEEEVSKLLPKSTTLDCLSCASRLSMLLPLEEFLTKSLSDADTPFSSNDLVASYFLHIAPEFPLDKFIQASRQSLDGLRLSVFCKGMASPLTLSQITQLLCALRLASSSFQGATMDVSWAVSPSEYTLFQNGTVGNLANASAAKSYKENMSEILGDSPLPESFCPELGTDSIHALCCRNSRSRGNIQTRLAKVPEFWLWLTMSPIHCADASWLIAQSGNLLSEDWCQGIIQCLVKCRHAKTMTIDTDQPILQFLTWNQGELSCFRTEGVCILTCLLRTVSLLQSGRHAVNSESFHVKMCESAVAAGSECFERQTWIDTWRCICTMILLPRVCQKSFIENNAMDTAEVLQQAYTMMKNADHGQKFVAAKSFYVRLSSLLGMELQSMLSVSDSAVGKFSSKGQMIANFVLDSLMHIHFGSIWCVGHAAEKAIAAGLRKGLLCTAFTCVTSLCNLISSMSAGSADFQLPSYMRLNFDYGSDTDMSAGLQACLQSAFPIQQTTALLGGCNLEISSLCHILYAWNCLQNTEASSADLIEIGSEPLSIAVHPFSIHPMVPSETIICPKVCLALQSLLRRGSVSDLQHVAIPFGRIPVSPLLVCLSTTIHFEDLLLRQQQALLSELKAAMVSCVKRTENAQDFENEKHSSANPIDEGFGLSFSIMAIMRELISPEDCGRSMAVAVNTPPSDFRLLSILKNSPNSQIKTALWQWLIGLAHLLLGICFSSTKPKYVSEVTAHLCNHKSEIVRCDGAALRSSAMAKQNGQQHLAESSGIYAGIWKHYVVVSTTVRRLPTSLNLLASLPYTPVLNSLLALTTPPVENEIPQALVNAPSSTLHHWQIILLLLRTYIWASSRDVVPRAHISSDNCVSITGFNAEELFGGSKLTGVSPELLQAYRIAAFCFECREQEGPTMTSGDQIHDLLSKLMDAVSSSEASSIFQTVLAPLALLFAFRAGKFVEISKHDSAIQQSFGLKPDMDERNSKSLDSHDFPGLYSCASAAGKISAFASGAPFKPMPIGKFGPMACSVIRESDSWIQGLAASMQSCAYSLFGYGGSTVSGVQSVQAWTNRQLELERDGKGCVPALFVSTISWCSLLSYAEHSTSALDAAQSLATECPILDDKMISNNFWQLSSPILSNLESNNGDPQSYGDSPAALHEQDSSIPSNAVDTLAKFWLVSILFLRLSIVRGSIAQAKEFCEFVVAGGTPLANSLPKDAAVGVVFKITSMEVSLRAGVFGSLIKPSIALGSLVSKVAPKTLFSPAIDGLRARIVLNVGDLNRGISMAKNLISNFTKVAKSTGFSEDVLYPSLYLAEVESTLGEAQIHAGLTREGEQNLLSALKRFRSVLWDSHPVVAGLLGILGSLWHAKGKYNDAMERADIGMNMLFESWVPWWTERASVHVALLCISQGNWQECKQVVDSCVSKIKQSDLPEESHASLPINNFSGGIGAERELLLALHSVVHFIHNPSQPSNVDPRKALVTALAAISMNAQSGNGESKEEYRLWPWNSLLGLVYFVWFRSPARLILTLSNEKAIGHSSTGGMHSNFLGPLVSILVLQGYYDRAMKLTAVEEETFEGKLSTVLAQSFIRIHLRELSTSKRLLDKVQKFGKQWLDGSLSGVLVMVLDGMLQAALCNFKAATSIFSKAINRTTTLLSAHHPISEAIRIILACTLASQGMLQAACDELTLVRSSLRQSALPQSHPLRLLLGIASSATFRLQGKFQEALLQSQFVLDCLESYRVMHNGFMFPGQGLKGKVMRCVFAYEKQQGIPQVFALQMYSKLYDIHWHTSSLSDAADFAFSRCINAQKRILRVDLAEVQPEVVELHALSTLRHLCNPISPARLSLLGDISEAEKSLELCLRNADICNAALPNANFHYCPWLLKCTCAGSWCRLLSIGPLAALEYIHDRVVFSSPLSSTLQNGSQAMQNETPREHSAGNVSGGNDEFTPWTNAGASDTAAQDAVDNSASNQSVSLDCVIGEQAHLRCTAVYYKALLGSFESLSSLSAELPTEVLFFLKIFDVQSIGLKLGVTFDNCILLGLIYAAVLWSTGNLDGCHSIAQSTLKYLADCGADGRYPVKCELESFAVISSPSNAVFGVSNGHSHTLPTLAGVSSRVSIWLSEARAHSTTSPDISTTQGVPCGDEDQGDDDVEQNPWSLLIHKLEDFKTSIEHMTPQGGSKMPSMSLAQLDSAMGWAFLGISEASSALEHFDSAKRAKLGQGMRPSHFSLIQDDLGRAQSFMAMGRETEAMQALSAVSGSDSGVAGDSKEFAMLLYQSGSFEACRTMCQRIMQSTGYGRDSSIKLREELSMCSVFSFASETWLPSRPSAASIQSLADDNLQTKTGHISLIAKMFWLERKMLRNGNDLPEDMSEQLGEESLQNFAPTFLHISQQFSTLEGESSYFSIYACCLASISELLAMKPSNALRHSEIAVERMLRNLGVSGKQAKMYSRDKSVNQPTVNSEIPAEQLASSSLGRHCLAVWCWAQFEMGNWSVANTSVRYIVSNGRWDGRVSFQHFVAQLVHYNMQSPGAAAATLSAKLDFILSSTTVHSQEQSMSPTARQSDVSLRTSLQADAADQNIFESCSNQIFTAWCCRKHPHHRFAPGSVASFFKFEERRIRGQGVALDSKILHDIVGNGQDNSGEHDTFTMSNLNAYRVLFYQRKWEEGIRLCTEALSSEGSFEMVRIKWMYRKAICQVREYGGESARVAVSSLLQQARDIFGYFHPDTMMIQTLLAECYPCNACGGQNDPELLALEAMKILSQHVGEKSLPYLSARRVAAYTVGKRGKSSSRFDESINEVLDVLECSRKVSVGNDVHIQTLKNASSLLFSAQRFEEAGLLAAELISSIKSLAHVNEHEFLKASALLAAVLGVQGKIEDATSTLPSDTLIIHDPELRASISMQKFEFLLKQGDLKSAATLCQNLLKTDIPVHWNQKFTLAQVSTLMKLKEYDQAEKICQKAVSNPVLSTTAHAKPSRPTLDSQKSSLVMTQSSMLETLSDIHYIKGDVAAAETSRSIALGWRNSVNPEHFPTNQNSDSSLALLRGAHHSQLSSGEM